MNEHFPGIAIDGPAGAGKSTVAKAVAKALGIRYLDTGAMYRAIALAVMNAGASLADEKAVEQILKSSSLELCYDERGQRVLLNGKDCTERLREEAVGSGASAVSKWPCVRDALSALQRQTAQRYPIVMDGRDIGTNVLPDTPYKFYVTASSAERARRRLLQLQQAGQDGDLDKILLDIEARDAADMGRSYMPLRKAEDAVCIDTTALTVEEATARIIREVNK